MKRPQEIQADAQDMRMLKGVTSVFESLASMRIAQIKNQVLQSQAFFDELWTMYTQLRVDANFHFGRTGSREILDRDLLIVVTAESGFSGDIDQKLIDLMLANYDSRSQDIVAIGRHGALQLAQANIPVKKYYKLPSRDQDINVSPIVKDLQAYRSTTVYYQTYVSLSIQDIKRISMSAMVQEKAKKAKTAKDEISEKTYIFEPSTYEVIDHLERSMLHIALSQVILDSKLAQYASRFQAMSRAHSRASEFAGELQTEYFRSRRASKDERLKEIVNGLRKTVLS